MKVEADQSATISGTPAKREPCVHESRRADGLLDNCCLRCGADGYWHAGHRHDRTHPSGKVLFSFACHPTEKQDA